MERKSRPDFFDQLKIAQDRIAKYSKIKTKKARSLLAFYRNAERILLSKASKEEMEAIIRDDQVRFS